MRFKIWVENNDQVFLGNGRVRLLEAIDRQGSITAAAKEMGMSYKKAWAQVNGMNSLASEPLVERFTGGKGGGGTQLTSTGKQWVKRFNQLKKKVDHFVQEESQQSLKVR